LPAEISPVVLLALADGVVLFSAAACYALMRKIKPAASLDIKEVYQVLDRSIEKYVPSLVQGYTWEEAFGRLRESGIKADWGELDKMLEEYEAYRYGGKEAPKTGQTEVVALALKLRRGVVGRRSKAKGA
jgi:hypothetical protein